MHEKLIRFPTHVIDNGVPAFPRLRLRITDLDYGEVDVLATLGNGLHVIEVTTRKSEKGVEDKLVKLQQIRTALNADEILLITTKENLEELEKTDHCSDIKCIALKNYPHTYKNTPRKPRKPSKTNPNITKTRTPTPTPHITQPSIHSLLIQFVKAFKALAVVVRFQFIFLIQRR